MISGRVAGGGVQDEVGESGEGERDFDALDRAACESGVAADGEVLLVDDKEIAAVGRSWWRATRRRPKERRLAYRQMTTLPTGDPRSAPGYERVRATGK
jgi:hypothetical protein